MGRIHPVNIEGESQLEYASNQNRIGRRTFTLTNATTDKRIEIGGNVLWVHDASDLDAEITVKFNDQDNDYVTLKKGMFIAGIKFSRLYVSWGAQAGKTITLIVTRENPRELLRIENATEDYTGVTLSHGSTTNSIADVTMGNGATTLIIAADSTRRRLLITNLSGNAETLRIGDDGAGATNGIPLAPGDTLTLDGDCQGAFYGYNPGGADQDVAVLSLED